MPIQSEKDNCKWQSIQQRQGARNNTGKSHGYDVVRKKARKQYIVRDSTCYRSETGSLVSVVWDADRGGGIVGEKEGDQHPRAQDRDYLWEGCRMGLW